MSYERPPEEPTRHGFIGREKELDFLNDKLQLAKAGKGQFVFVYGESGIGKTELVKKFLKDKDDCLTAKHECKQNSLDIVFNALLTKFIKQYHKKYPKKFKHIGTALGKTILDLGPDAIAAFRTPATTLLSLGVKGLKQVKKELDKSRESSIEKFNNYTPIYIKQLEILSQEEPLILFIDDIHDIDSASTDILNELISSQRHSSNRILVVGTYQDEILQTKEDKKLKDLFANAISQSRSSIDNDNSKCCAKYLLEGFNNEEYESLIEVRYPKTSDDFDNFVEKLKTHTSKNPMFVIEILEYFEEKGSIYIDGTKCWKTTEPEITDIPESIAEAIIAKLDRLTTEEREFIEKASVFGFNWIEEVVRASIEKLAKKNSLSIIKDLKKKHRLIEDGEPINLDRKYLVYKFRHKIIYENIYLKTIEDTNDKYIYHEEIAQAFDNVFGEKLNENFFPYIKYFRNLHLLVANDFIDSLISEEVTDKTPKSPEDNKLLMETVDNYTNIAWALFNQYAMDEAQEQIEKAHALLAKVPENSENYDETKFDYLNITYRLKSWRGNYADALSIALEMEKIADKLDDTEKKALVYGQIGYSNHYLGDLDEALEYYKKAMDIATEMNDMVKVATMSNNIGLVHQAKGDFDKALEYYQKALEILIEIDHKVYIAATYNNIGGVHHYKGDFDKALEYYNKALDILIEIDHKVYIATTYNNIGEAYRAKGDFEKALKYYQKALDIDEGLKNWVAVATRYNNIASVYYAKGDFDQALDYYQKALEIDEGLKNWYSVAARCWNIGGLYMINLNNQAEGMKYYMQAFQIWKQTGGNIPPEIRPQLPQHVIDFIESDDDETIMNLKAKLQQSRTNLMKAEICHDLHKHYLTLNNVKQADHYIMKSFEFKSMP